MTRESAATSCLAALMFVLRSFCMGDLGGTMDQSAIPVKRAYNKEKVRAKT
jgi:hypothetical protein